MRFGVIDIGSNSIKLLIAESSAILAVCYQTTCETRIGTELGKEDPFITRTAMRDALIAIKSLLNESAAYNPRQFFLVGTSALREASNREEFIELVFQETGHRLQVLSGEQEAAYIAYGIKKDSTLGSLDELALVDLGGGSMECIHLRRGNIVSKVSLPLGSVRLSTQYLRSTATIMKSEEMRAITQRVTEEISASGFHFPTADAVLAGTGGALSVARKIRAAWLGASFEEVGNILSINFLEYLFLEMASLPRKERCRIPHVPKERSDIMPTALLVLITVMRIAKANTFLHTTHNLRYGIAAEVHSRIAESQSNPIVNFPLMH